MINASEYPPGYPKPVSTELPTWADAQAADAASAAMTASWLGLVVAIIAAWIGIVTVRRASAQVGEQAAAVGLQRKAIEADAQHRALEHMRQVRGQARLVGVSVDASGWLTYDAEKPGTGFAAGDGVATHTRLTVKVHNDSDVRIEFIEFKAGFEFDLVSDAQNFVRRAPVGSSIFLPAMRPHTTFEFFLYRNDAGSMVKAPIIWRNASTLNWVDNHDYFWERRESITRLVAEWISLDRK